MKPAFLWVDFETTGLDPSEDLPLAVGIIITDFAFREIARREWVIGWRGIWGRRDRASPIVRAMHDKSGLWSRVAVEPNDLRKVDWSIYDWIQEHVGVPDPVAKNRPAYAGNSVHFDKRFMEEWFPMAKSHFSYRCLDVSTLKLLAMATIPGAQEWNDSRPEAAHTPLADLDASITELAHWRKVLKEAS